MLKETSGISNLHIKSPKLLKAGSSSVCDVKFLQHQLFSPYKIGKYLHFSLCSGTETEEGPWRETENISFTSRWFNKAGKKIAFMPKRNIKASPLEKLLLKSQREYHSLFLKGMYLGTSTLALASNI
ncbi:hypothetical protein Tco_1401330 [Tanacetum coccineum]